MNEPEPVPVDVNVSNENDPVAQQREKDVRMWAMILHLSSLTSYATGIGLFAPILIWQLKKDEFPELDAHGKMASNWALSLFIYDTVATVLLFVLIGIVILPVLAIVSIIFPIIAGIKANNGELWHYPMTIQFLK